MLPDPIDVPKWNAALEERDEMMTIRISTFEVFSTYFLFFLNQADWGEC